jgi:hypothetical protein
VLSTAFGAGLWDSLEYIKTKSTGNSKKLNLFLNGEIPYGNSFYRNLEFFF